MVTGTRCTAGLFISSAGQSKVWLRDVSCSAAAVRDTPEGTA